MAVFRYFDWFFLRCTRVPHSLRPLAVYQWGMRHGLRLDGDTYFVIGRFKHRLGITQSWIMSNLGIPTVYQKSADGPPVQPCRQEPAVVQVDCERVQRRFYNKWHSSLGWTGNRLSQTIMLECIFYTINDLILEKHIKPTPYWTPLRKTYKRKFMFSDLNLKGCFFHPLSFNRTGECVRNKMPYFKEGKNYY